MADERSARLQRRVDSLLAERVANHALYAAAIKDRDHWKERHHKVAARNDELRELLDDATAKVVMRTEIS